MFGLTRTIIIINVTPVSPVTAAHTDLLSHPCSWLYDEVNDPNSAVQKTFCFADYHAWEKTIDYRNRSPISSTSISSDRLLRRIFFLHPPAGTQESHQTETGASLIGHFVLLVQFMVQSQHQYLNCTYDRSSFLWICIMNQSDSVGLFHCFSLFRKI